MTNNANGYIRRRPSIAQTFANAEPTTDRAQKKVNTSIWITVEMQRKIRIAAAERDMRMSEFIEHAVNREIGDEH